MLLAVNVCLSRDNVLNSLRTAASLFCNLCCCLLILNMRCFILHAISGMQLYWTSKLDMKLLFDHFMLCFSGSWEVYIFLNLQNALFWFARLSSRDDSAKEVQWGKKIKVGK